MRHSNRRSDQGRSVMDLSWHANILAAAFGYAGDDASAVLHSESPGLLLVIEPRRGGRSPSRRPQPSGQTRPSWRPTCRRPRKSSTECFSWRRSTRATSCTTWAAATAAFRSRRPSVYGARGVGVDIDPQRIAEANANAKQAGVAHLVTLQAAGRDGHRRVRGHRRDALSAVGVQPQAAADSDPAAQARRAHRVACLQHGRLAARQGRHLHRYGRTASAHCICGRPTERFGRRRDVPRRDWPRVAPTAARLERQHATAGVGAPGDLPRGRGRWSPCSGEPARRGWRFRSLAFVPLLFVHARVLNARDRAARAAAFYERGLARLEDRWQGTGERGERFRDPDAPLRRGSRSLRRRRAVRAAGHDAHARRRGRARRLAAARPPIRRRFATRQAAVAELAPRLDLREDLAVLGPGRRGGGAHRRSQGVGGGAAATRRAGGRASCCRSSRPSRPVWSFSGSGPAQPPDCSLPGARAFRGCWRCAFGMPRITWPTASSSASRSCACWRR